MEQDHFDRAVEWFRLRLYERSEPDLNSGCVLWARRVDSLGYGKVVLGSHHYKTHRLSYAINHGKNPGKLFVLHSCDTPSCINPAHLRLGTHDDNMRDCKERDRFRRGSANPNSKLSESQVVDIYLSSDAISELADRHGCSLSTVRAVRWRHIWTHITGSLATPLQHSRQGLKP